MGLKEELLALADRPFEEVPVPEWDAVLKGAKLRITAMSAADRDAWELEAYLERKGVGAAAAKNVRAKLVARCLVDESGERVFGEADVAALGRKSAKALDRLFDVAQRLNGLTETEMKAIEGNSKGVPPDA